MTVGTSRVYSLTWTLELLNLPSILHFPSLWALFTKTLATFRSGPITVDPLLVTPASH